MKDFIKRMIYGGKIQVVGICLKGELKSVQGWADTDGVEMSASGIRKRITANEKKRKDNPTRLTPEEIVYLPSRGNGLTGETEQSRTRMEKKRVYEVDASFPMTVMRRSWFPVSTNGVEL